MIYVCMALHDEKGSYAKYTAVTMASVLLNTKEDVTFFLLHDDTLTERNKHRFIQIAELYNQHISFIKVAAVVEWQKLKNLKVYTIGTMYRLVIPAKLPDYVEKVLYLDSDVVVDMDIRELWNQDFGGKLLLGRRELHYDNPIFQLGVNEESYVNAGVLLMDLKKIRAEHDFLRETTEYLRKFPDCMWNDEDAINYVLNKKQGVISNRFNVYTYCARKGKESFQGNCIFHFAGDFPRITETECYDRLFFKMLKKTPFGTNDENNALFYHAMDYEKKISLIIHLLKQLNRAKTIVFWGAKKTDGYNEIKHLVSFPGKEVFFIDSNVKLKDSQIDGYYVKIPEFLKDLKEQNDVFIVVLAYRHYEEIGAELKEMGYQENVNFASVRHFLFSAVSELRQKEILADWCQQ